MGALTAKAGDTDPTVGRPGEQVVTSEQIKNNTDLTLRGFTPNLAVMPPYPSNTHGAGAPSMAWRVDGGPWYPISLTWTAFAAPVESKWEIPGGISTNLTLAPGTTHTFDLRASFATDSVYGDYYYELAYWSDTCGGVMLALNNEGAYYAKPVPQPAHTPTTGNAPAPSHPAHSPAPQPSTSSASPQSSPTPTPSPAAASTPSAPSTAASPSALPRTLTAADPAAPANRPGPLPFLAALAAAGSAAALVGVRLRRRRHPR